MKELVIRSPDFLQKLHYVFLFGWFFTNSAKIKAYNFYAIQ